MTVLKKYTIQIQGGPLVVVDPNKKTHDCGQPPGSRYRTIKRIIDRDYEDEIKILEIICIDCGCVWTEEEDLYDYEDLNDYLDGEME